VVSFTEALEDAQITNIVAMADDTDSNENIVRRWYSTDHGDNITIELYVDNFLDITSEKDGISFYSDWIGEMDYE
tara:strand:+ start:189 stop:413 length:225 start_codon:yes stop_codon:yes gene_type:complete